MSKKRKKKETSPKAQENFEDWLQEEDEKTAKKGQQTEIERNHYIHRAKRIIKVANENPTD